MTSGDGWPVVPTPTTTCLNALAVVERQWAELANPISARGPRTFER